jgi:tetrahydromethanopterin S-methyltransferase subunit G
MEAMRQSWSDDRLDDLSNRVEAGFTRVDARIDDLGNRVEAGFARVDARIDDLSNRVDARINDSAAELRQEMHMRFDRIDARFDAMQQTIIRVGGGLIGVLVAAGAGLIATQL